MTRALSGRRMTAHGSIGGNLMTGQDLYMTLPLVHVLLGNLPRYHKLRR